MGSKPDQPCAPDITKRAQHVTGGTNLQTENDDEDVHALSPLLAGGLERRHTLRKSGDRDQRTRDLVPTDIPAVLFRDVRRLLQARAKRVRRYMRDRPSPSPSPSRRGGFRSFWSRTPAGFLLRPCSSALRVADASVLSFEQQRGDRSWAREPPAPGVLSSV